MAEPCVKIVKKPSVLLLLGATMLEVLTWKLTTQGRHCLPCEIDELLAIWMVAYPQSDSDIS